MQRMLILLVTIWLAAAEPPVNELPPELSHLQQLLNDEDRLVEAVRQFDRQQQALMIWDQDLAKNHEANRENALAQEKRAEIARRIALIDRAYTEVLKRYPKNARALNYQGELYYDWKDDEEKGVKLWQQAADLNPKLPEPFNNLAIHYSHIGEYDLAFDCFEKALKLAPNNPDFLYNVAQMYFVHFPEVQKRYKWDKNRVYEEGMKLSKRSAELGTDSFELLRDYAFNFFVGDMQFGVKVDWKAASVAWQRARERARNDGERFYTWLNEARVWIRAAEPEKAIPCLEEALKLRPSDELAAKLLREAKATDRESGESRRDSRDESKAGAAVTR